MPVPQARARGAWLPEGGRDQVGSTVTPTVPVVKLINDYVGKNGLAPKKKVRR